MISMGMGNINILQLLSRSRDGVGEDICMPDGEENVYQHGLLFTIDKRRAVRYPFQVIQAWRGIGIPVKTRPGGSKYLIAENFVWVTVLLCHKFQFERLFDF